MNGRDADSKVLVALQRVEKLSPRRRSLLLEQCTLPSGLLSEEMRPALNAALGESVTDFFRFLDEWDEWADSVAERGMGWVTVLDDEYSDLLRETEGCPPVLFTKGNAGLLNTFSLAIVGTRRPTRYGAKIADEFARAFAAAGVTVVSGFARGIDSCAHRACVESDAPTVAVFGCGVDVCYPAENRELYDAVLSGGGLFVSEYPPGAHPMPYRFPERNRIISGLCRGVLLPEAAEKSGSLITANTAVEQGRDLFVVPGNIYSPESRGTNALLGSMPHALTLSPEDVLERYRITAPAKEKEEAVQFDMTETLVLGCLHEGEKHFEELLAETGLKAQELSTVLVNLELAGALVQTGGNHYALC